MTSKAWCFTLNNPTSNSTPEEWTDSVAYCVWQLEKGESGTPHLQGYLQLKKKGRLSFLKKLSSSAHWEMRKFSHQDCVNYCTKESDEKSTRLDGPWTYGVPTKGQGQRNDLLALKEAADQGQTERAIAMNPETFPAWAKYYRALGRYQLLSGQKRRTWATKTVVYWGPSGTGKSSRALIEGGADAYWLPKPHNNGGVWWDGYDGQETVVIDEFYGWIPRDMMQRICDRYPLNLQTKGGVVPFLAKKVIITSNKAPEDWWRMGLGAMERRLTGELGEVHNIKTYLDPEQPIPATLFPCLMCNQEVAVAEHALCEDCFPQPTLTDLYCNDE